MLLGLSLLVFFLAQNIKINKTVGWAFDLSTLIIPVLIVFIVFYSAFYFMKIKTNNLFSIISIALILLSLMLFKNGSNFVITFILSILVFISNSVYSVYLKIKSL
jgi:energy-coupling factor transporter transmembrane protein EcfT